MDMMGAVNAVAVVTPALDASDSGSIVFMSSTAALETFMAPQAFNAMKAALITYGSQLSQALAAQGVKVNVCFPWCHPISDRELGSNQSRQARTL